MGECVRCGRKLTSGGTVCIPCRNNEPITLPHPPPQTTFNLDYVSNLVNGPQTIETQNIQLGTNGNECAYCKREAKQQCTSCQTLICLSDKCLFLKPNGNVCPMCNEWSKICGEIPLMSPLEFSMMCPYLIYNILGFLTCTCCCLNSATNPMLIRSWSDYGLNVSITRLQKMKGILAKNPNSPRNLVFYNSLQMRKYQGSYVDYKRRGLFMHPKIYNIDVNNDGMLIREGKIYDDSKGSDLSTPLLQSLAHNE